MQIDVIPILEPQVPTEGEQTQGLLMLDSRGTLDSMERIGNVRPVPPAE